ncbi:MAG: vWA domain-containing protein [Deltaproteobacteria bacterium]|nr:vWA domain-containing protein [Deltaproteobacteria bacterium]
MKNRQLRSLLLLVVAGCGADTTGTGSGSGTDAGSRPGFGNGGANGGGLFADALLNNPNGTGSGPGGITDVCGLKNFDLANLPGEMMLVLDKSGSMRDGFRNSGGQSKWEASTQALDSVIKATQSKVSWGLKLYPQNGACGTAGPPNPGVAPNNHAAIMMQIGMFPPMEGQYTPTRAAVESSVAYLKGLTTANPKFIMLATDGEPNCINGEASTAKDGDGAVAAVTAAVAAGFPVFVLGVSADKATATVLNQLAVAGGRARMGDTKYYPANSRVELEAAMTDIAGQIVTCTFQLGTPPPSPTDVAVEIDNKRYQRDVTHTTGWDYGAGNTSISFFGTVCEDIKSGKLKDVKFTFGCPGMPIP